MTPIQTGPISRAILIALLSLTVTACASAAPKSRMGGAASDPAPRTLLDAAAAAMEKATSYHMSGTVAIRVAGEELHVRIESDVQRPDRVRAATTIGGTVVESISIGGDSWVRDPKTLNWKNEVASGNSAAPADPFAILRLLTDVRWTGREILDGVSADRVQGHAPANTLMRAFSVAGAPAVAQGDVIVTVWVRQTDSLVARIAAKPEGSAAFEISTAFSLFGTDFGIAPPA